MLQLNRRHFFQWATAAAGVTALRADKAARPLPPAIAALKSMKDLAKPITIEERQARIVRAQEIMSERRIDAVMLAGGTSLNYFTGVRWGNSERMFVVVLPAKGRAFSVCPSFEEDRAREQLNRGPLENAEVLTWHEDDSPYDVLAQALKSRSMATGSLGVEERTPFVFSASVGKSAPALKMADATPVTSLCRMIKTPHEIELMTIANRATLAVYKAVYASIQPGMTQRDVGSLINAAYSQVGFPGEASVQVGEYSALPHGSMTPQVINQGTIVMIDDGCTVEGYQSDITRTFVLGQPTDRMKKVFDIVHRAQKAALDAAVPNAECQGVDAAARKVIVDAGFGPDYTYFSHRVGHGIGMDGHEWPYLVRGNKLSLQAGMTFSDEPGIYIKGEFGVRLEDDMYITPDGARLFTPQSPSLEHPFGS